MKLIVDLDAEVDSGCYHTEVISDLIKQEINSAIREEVRKSVRAVVGAQIKEMERRLIKEFTQVKLGDSQPIIELLVKLKEANL